MKLKRLHYGWVIVLITALVLATQGFIFYTFGIFLVPLTTEFNWDRGVLSAALSINALVGGGVGLLSGRLSDKYGPRLLVTANGLLTGIGFLLLSKISSLWQVYLIWGVPLSIAGSCAFIPLLSTIPRWFVKKRGIAAGIAVAGFGLGGTISPPIAQWLISTYGWRQAYIILGLIILITVTPLAQFVKHSPQRSGLEPYGGDGAIEEKQSSATEGVSLKQSIKSSRFWLLGSVLGFFFFFLQVIIIHIAPYAVDNGIPAAIAAGILSVIATSSLIGRLSMGFIAEKVGARRVLPACLTVITLALVWLLFVREIWTFYIFAGVFGVAYGSVIPLETLLPAELFGLGSLGIILGSLTLFSTIGGAIGAPLAGSIFDITGSYRLAFIICLILSTLALILSVILLRSKGKEAQYIRQADKISLLGL